MRVSEPDRDSSPVSEFHIAVITDVSTKVRISSAEIYPSEMETMAESILVSSSSVMVIDESITESPSFSVKVRLPLPSLLPSLRRKPKSSEFEELFRMSMPESMTVIPKSHRMYATLV